MKLKFTGDFRDLDAFVNRVARAPERMAEVNKQLAEEALELVREGFETSTDPYGKRWADLKIRSGRPLEDTGALKVWRRQYASTHGFGIFSPREYAVYHQQGTGIYGPKRRPIRPVQGRALRFPVPGGIAFATEVQGTPARKMVPDAGPLPSRWRERFVDTAHETMREIFTE